MKYIRNLLLFLSVLALGIIAKADPPSYSGNSFDAVQTAADDATLFFGVIVVLAVLVTGFFVGRRWLKRVG